MKAKKQRGYAIESDPIHRELKVRACTKERAEEHELMWFETKEEAETYLQNLWEIE